MADKVASVLKSPAARRRSLSLAERWRKVTDQIAEHPVMPLGIHEFNQLWGQHFDRAELDALVVPRRTLARRKAATGRLSLAETDRALRLARIAALADRVFANQEKSARWLRKPQQRLAGRAPLQLLDSEAGAVFVEELLGQIEHGMFA